MPVPSRAYLFTYHPTRMRDNQRAICYLLSVIHPSSVFFHNHWPHKTVSPFMYISSLIPPAFYSPQGVDTHLWPCHLARLPTPHLYIQSPTPIYFYISQITPQAITSLCYLYIHIYRHDQRVSKLLALTRTLDFGPRRDQAVNTIMQTNAMAYVCYNTSSDLTIIFTNGIKPAWRPRCHHLSAARNGLVPYLLSYLAVAHS